MKTRTRRQKRAAARMAEQAKIAKQEPRMAGGPFDGWKLKHVPTCVTGVPGRRSDRGLGKKQRNHVLVLLGFPSYAAYLASELWGSIRDRVFANGNTSCACGCGRAATVVHHKHYSEANLLGVTLHGLLPMHRDCHHGIEFEEGRKSSLARANKELKARRRANERTAKAEAALDAACRAAGF